MRRRSCVLACILLGCGTSQEAPPQPRQGRAKPRSADPTELISADRMRSVVKVLASDAFEGRGTGTNAAARTTAWIAARMQAIGLRPAGEGEGFEQAVRMVGFGSHFEEVALGDTPLAPGTFVFNSELATGRHEDRLPLVRAGFGIVAPEHRWDDYDGLDVTGAVVVVRAGEPDEGFNGRALTEHGRWTTKLDRARERGAAGCVLVHDDRGAGYPWSVVRASFEGERFALRDGPQPPLSLWGWLRSAPAESTKRLRVRLEQTTRRLVANNVVGATGSGQGPFVVVTAHWDHLGVGPEGIFNGALDNASGVAAMLALAEAVQRQQEVSPLEGTVLFAATAAEEVGLLGGTVLADSLDPSVVVAAINFDGMNVGPVTASVELVAPRRSTMDDLFNAALRQQGRRAIPDQSPGDGAAFRSDHLPFAQRGIPTLYPQPSYADATDLRWARERSRRYHTVDDVFDPAWTFEGAIADTKAVYEVVIDLANGEVRPQLRPDANVGR